ncbi:MAG: hypothetical protein JSU07_14225 [Bacteroidetes bacterium]|nr:hypothetical protein [Bacteroidota bacterium]
MHINCRYKIILILVLILNNNKAQNKNNQPKLDTYDFAFNIGITQGVDPLLNYGREDFMATHSGVIAGLYYKRVGLTYEGLFLNKLVSEDMISPSIYSPTYKIIYGRGIGISLGYSENTWASSYYSSGYQDAQTHALDSKGSNHVLNGLITYKAPSFILGYQFNLFDPIKNKKFNIALDEYDKKHQSKLLPAMMFSGSIDLYYAPSLYTDSTTLFSHYGMFVPEKLKVYAPMNYRHWGIMLKAVVSLPYLIGFNMGVGFKPGIYPKKENVTIDVNITGGIVLMLNRVKPKMKPNETN